MSKDFSQTCDDLNTILDELLLNSKKNDQRLAQIEEKVKPLYELELKIRYLQSIAQKNKKRKSQTSTQKNKNFELN